MSEARFVRGQSGRRYRRLRHGLALGATPLLGLSALVVASPGSQVGAATNFTGAPLVIGTVQEIGTSGFNTPGPQDAANAAVSEINATGGIKTADGKTHQLKLISCNGQNTTNGSVTCAQTFIADNAIATVGSVDIYSAGGDPLLTKAGIPEFADGANDLWDLAGTNSYPITGSAVFGYAGLGKVLAQEGIKSARPMGISESASQLTGLISAFKVGLATGGGTTLDTTLYPAATTDFSPVTAQALAGNPGAVVIIASAQNVESISQAAVQLGGKLPNFADDAGTITLQSIKATGGKSGPLEGAYVDADGPSVSTIPGYVAAINKYQPHANPNDVFGGGYDVSAAENTFVGMYAFKTLMGELSGTVTAAKFKTLLNRTTDLKTLGNISPPINFTKPFPCGPFARAFDPDYYAPLKVENGKFVALHGAKLQDATSLILQGFGKECSYTAAQLGVS